MRRASSCSSAPLRAISVLLVLCTCAHRRAHVRKTRRNKASKANACTKRDKKQKAVRSKLLERWLCEEQRTQSERNEAKRNEAKAHRLECHARVWLGLMAVRTLTSEHTAERLLAAVLKYRWVLCYSTRWFSLQGFLRRRSGFKSQFQLLRASERTGMNAFST